MSTNKKDVISKINKVKSIKNTITAVDAFQETLDKTDEVNLALIERHFIALQIQMESNDENFNKLFSKGMISEDIKKIRDAKKNKIISADEGKRFTADPKNAENVKKATTLLDEKIKKRKANTDKKIKEIEKKRDEGGTFTGNEEELLKYYTDEDEWKYRIITKEFIRTQMSNETGKITIYSILRNIIEKKKSGVVTDYNEFVKKNPKTPNDLFDSIITEKDEKTSLQEILTVKKFIESIFDIIKNTKKYKKSEKEKVEDNDPIIVKRLLKVLEYVVESLPQYYGEVPYSNRDSKGSTPGFLGGILGATDTRIHDVNGKTRNMPLGISSKQMLNRIEDELKLYIDSTTVSTDYRYNNVERLLRCSKRFNNFNSRIILPMYISLTDSLFNELFPNDDGKQLTYNEIVAHLLNGESILEIIKKDRDIWIEIEKYYEKLNKEELKKRAFKHLSHNIGYLLTHLFSKKNAIAGFFDNITGKKNTPKKTLNSNGTVITIDEYSWKNEKKFLESLNINLEGFIEKLSKKDNIEKKQSCESSITIGSNIDNDGKYDKDDDEAESKISLSVLPEINIVVYPSNCSSSEIGAHKCGERKAEIKVLFGKYMDRTKGRKYKGDNDPEIEEKNIVNLIKRSKTTPLKCEGKKDNTKNTQVPQSQQKLPEKPIVDPVKKPIVDPVKKPTVDPVKKPPVINVDTNVAVAPAAGGRKNKKSKKNHIKKYNKKTKRKTKTRRYNKKNKRKTKK